jgi:hypothetical protein
MDPLITADLERQIVKYELHFDSIKDDEIEWKYQPPPFVVAFVAFVERCGRIPSQREFADFYFATHRLELRAAFDERWRDEDERNRKKLALAARLGRAYPSFVRDVYLLALLREHQLDARYDARDDVEGGVDLIVLHESHTLCVHVFLDTQRSREGRTRKNRRHIFTGEHFDLVLNPRECKRVGKFWLPTQHHVELIRRQLINRSRPVATSNA